MIPSPGTPTEEPRPDGEYAGLTRRATVVLFLVLAAVAVFTRVLRFWEAPYLGFVDIGAHAEATLDLLRNGFKAPWDFGWGNVPYFYWYTLIPFFKVFSPPILAQKIAVLTFSLLALVLSYLFLRDLGGKLLALLGLTVLVFNRYFLFYSRYPMEPVTLFCFFVATALCFRRGLLGKARPALLYSITAGFLLAAAQHVYLSSRFLIPTFLGYLLYLGVSHRHCEGIFRRGGIFLATFAICVLPLAHSYWGNREALTTRHVEIGVLGKVQAGDLASNYFETFRAFLDRPDPSSCQNLPLTPLINPLLAVLFLLGLASTAVLWRTEAAVFGVLTFFLTLPATSLTFEVHNSKRILNALLGFAILVAWPWALALGRLGLRTRLGRTVLIGWLAVVAGFGVWDFKVLFVDFATDPETIEGSGYHQVAIALRTAQEAVANDVVLPPGRLGPQSFSFHPGVRVEGFDFSRLIPIGRRRDRDVVFLLDSGDQSWLPLLRAFYPTCSMKELSYGHGYFGIRFQVSAAEINSRVGVRGRVWGPNGLSPEERVLAPDAKGTFRFEGVPPGKRVDAHGLVYFSRTLELGLEGEGEVSIDVDGASPSRLSLRGTATVALTSGGKGWRPWTIAYEQASHEGKPFSVTAKGLDTQFFAGAPPEFGYRVMMISDLTEVRNGTIAYVPAPFVARSWSGLPLAYLAFAGELEGPPGEWEIQWQSVRKPRMALGSGPFQSLGGTESSQYVVQTEGPTTICVLFDARTGEANFSLQTLHRTGAAGGVGDAARLRSPRQGLGELVAWIDSADLSDPVEGLGRVRAVRQDYGSLERDRSVDGHSLRVGGRQSRNGLGTHANSQIALTLLPGHSALTGAVGVDDEVGAHGSVVFRILAGDTEIWKSGVLHGGMPAVPFRIDVTGISQLDLVVEDAGDGKEFDHANWVDLRLQ